MHLADIFQQYLADYDTTYKRSTIQHRVCQAIQTCRTPALGGFKRHCHACGHDDVLYHACRIGTALVVNKVSVKHGSRLEWPMSLIVLIFMLSLPCLMS